MSNQVKEAKKFLDKKGIKGIKPVQLSQAAKQLNKSLSETLKLIARLRSGGQGQGAFPETGRVLRKGFNG